MPIYEYQCEGCQHHLEALQKISDVPLRRCPQCGRAKLRRLISPPVFRLKGSGWYETDFKSDKEGRRNLAERPEPESGEGEKKDAAGTVAPAEGKAEGKTETRTEAATAASSETKPAAKPAAPAPGKPRRPPRARKAGVRKAAGRL